MSKKNCAGQVMPAFDDLGALCCAACGGHCLHHYRVRVYDRREDRPTCVVTDVVDHMPSESSETPAHLQVRTEDNRDNPSARRGAVSVMFWCEFCSAITRLDIAQHKGSTFVTTRHDGDVRS